MQQQPMLTHPGRRLAAALTLALALVTGCQASPTPPSPTQAPAPSTPSTTPTLTTPGQPTNQTQTASGQGSELRKLEVPEVGFAEPVSPLSSVAMGNAIDPPLYSEGKPSLPVRVSDKGVQPSKTADDTTYVGCHTSAKSGADAYPCNVLIRTVKKGSTIIATTDAGTLTYTVTETRSIPKDAFASDDQTWRIEPKRLVIVVCDIVDGTGNGANWVIYASVA